MKKIINIILLVLLSTPVFSQGFNDSIMNHVLYDMVVEYTMKRDTTVNLYFTEVGAELHSKHSVEYMITNGVRHMPSHSYINSLPNDEAMMILDDIGWDTTESIYVGRCEILARIGIIGETTYQKVAERALNGWLNSNGHMGTIKNMGVYNNNFALGISSSYDKKTQSIYIALTSFSILE